MAVAVERGPLLKNMELKRKSRNSNAPPCEYGERRDSFDFEFRNKVDINEVLNGRIDPNSPNYLDGELVEGKQNLRDINTIPSIMVESPTPERVQLRPVQSELEITYRGVYCVAVTPGLLHFA